MKVVEGGRKVVKGGQKVVRRWLHVVGRWFWFHKIVFTGGFQPSRPPGGGPAAPRAPLHTERLRLSGSPFFLVPRSWYQDLGTKILVTRTLR